MNHRTLFSITAAAVLGVLPSCGDDDGGDGGPGTGGRAATGGAPASGGSGGAGARTGGTGGEAGARGGMAGQPSAGGAAGESATTGGAGGAPETGGAAGESTSGGANDAGAAGDAGTAGAGVGGSAQAGAGGSAGDTETGAGGGGEGGAAGEPGALADPEILHVVTTANQGEIEQATIAINRATDESVLAFAEMMLEEHGASLAEGSALSQSLGLANNPTSLELMTASNAVVVQLKAASPEAFDGLYIESQVMAHETVLALLEEELLPAADDAALETYLETMQVAVAAHLQTAQDLAEALE